MTSHRSAVASQIASFVAIVVLFLSESPTSGAAQNDIQPEMNHCYNASFCYEEECDWNLIPCKESCRLVFTIDMTGQRRILYSLCFAVQDDCTLNDCQYICGNANSKNITHCHCCCTGDLCNQKIGGPSPFNSEPPTKPLPTAHRSTNPTTKTSEVRVIVIAIAATVGCVVFVAAIFVISFYWWSRRHVDEADGGSEIEMAAMEERPDNDTTILYPAFDLTAIRKERHVGIGRFAHVWKVRLDEDVYAAKIFPRAEMKSWNSEVEGYMKPCIKHENVLKFITAGKREKEDGSGLIEYWILTELHEMGSLMDFLKNTSVTFHELCKLTRSVACGLAYLHTEQVLPGGAMKPAIAHRDVKSRNVLVKNKTVCCISDLGLAMKFQPGTSFVEAQGQVGTIRYMAPEVLEGAINFHKESFLRIDVYAMALVLWEILSRCNTGNGVLHDYKQPFEEEVGSHPCFEDMKECVVKLRMRPQFLKNPDSLLPLEAFEEMIEECWDPEAEARLTAHCVEERISQLETCEKSVVSSGYVSMEPDSSSLPQHQSAASLNATMPTLTDSENSTQMEVPPSDGAVVPSGLPVAYSLPAFLPPDRSASPPPYTVEDPYSAPAMKKKGGRAFASFAFTKAKDMQEGSCTETSL